MNCTRNMVTMIRIGQNVQRIGHGEIGEPEPVRLAQLHRIQQHAIVGEEERHLQQHRQASAVHVYAFRLVELHHLGVHLGPLGSLTLRWA